MELDYRVKELIHTFTEHTAMQKAHHEQVVAQFKEQFPDQELPPALKDQFNISEALTSMCKEIVELKDMVQRLVRSQEPKCENPL